MSELDSISHWGGLQTVSTQEGEVRHVCENHARLYHLKESTQTHRAEPAVLINQPDNEPRPLGTSQIREAPSLDTLAAELEIPTLFLYSKELTTQDLLSMNYEQLSKQYGLTTDDYMKIKKFKNQMNK